jgi:agmatinase
LTAAVAQGSGRWTAAGIGVATLAEMFGTAGAATFLGLPRGDAADPQAAVAILGADGCTPYASVGFYCAGGPAAIRAAAAPYAANLHHVDFDLGRPVLPAGVRAVDCGDLAVDPADAAGNRARLEAAVAGLAAAGAVPVLLGGDDSVPTPMLAALAARGPLWVLQIDAHIDWRDEVGGERWGLSSTMRRAAERPGIAGIVQVGRRGIGSARPSDLEAAEAAGVTFVPARAVLRDGIGAALAAIPAGARVAVCLDLDALDPAVMPAVIGRMPGGLGYWDVLGLIEGAAARGRIAGLAMVEFMPARDIDGQGATVAAGLLAAAVGLIAGQPGG